MKTKGCPIRAPLMSRFPTPKPLTDEQVQLAPARPDGDYYLVDGVVRGLWLRVYPSGKKVFVLRFTDADERRVQVRLGDISSVSLAVARSQALDHITRARGGIVQTPTTLTFQIVAEEYLEAMVCPDASARTIREYRRQLERVLYPALGKQRIRAIKLKAILKVLASYARKPYWNRLIDGLLWPIFEYAVEQGYADRNIARSLGRVTENARKPRLNESQIAELHSVIDQLVKGGGISVTAAWAIRLIMATGAHPEEIMNLQWANLNHEEGQIQWPMTKNGPKPFPLSPIHIQVLEAIPRIPGHPFVFPGRRKNLPLTTLSKAWLKIRAAANLPGFQLRDFRHVFGNRSRQFGDVLVQKHLLNHKTFEMVERYGTPNVDELSRVAGKTAAWMLAGSKCMDSPADGPNADTTGKEPGEFESYRQITPVARGA